MKINKIIVFFVSLIFLWPSVTICAKVEFKKNIKEKANIEKDIQEKVGIKTFDEKKSRIGNTYQVHIKKVDSLVVALHFHQNHVVKMT